MFHRGREIAHVQPYLSACAQSMSDHGEVMTELIQTRLLALGDWPAENLHSSWTTSTFALPPELAEEVEQGWKNAGARPGVHLFDGPLCRLEQFTAHDGLRLKLSPTSYKYFIGTNGQHPTWGDRYGQQVMANPVGTSVLLRSSDGHLVCGRRTESVALYPGCAHPFGGTLEPGVNGNAPELMAEILRELAEEVNLQVNDLSDIRAIGLVEDRQLRQPELVYIATTKISAKNITARIDPVEHHASWSIPDHSDAMMKTLATGTAITPVLAATLLAYGRWHYGETWLLQQLSNRHVDDRKISNS
jgi:hypothetical protein